MTSHDSERPTDAISGKTARVVPREVEEAAIGAHFGKFVRVKRLGSGGMGEVWKAWDGGLARWVALKFVKGRDADDLARFAREAQLAGRLAHANIAAVYEIELRGDAPYIAMQYIDGVTLRSWRTTDRRAAATAIRDAARAVEYAHGQGVVHRDLKPENIMISGELVTVMDFGLARQVEAGSKLTVSGLVVGTASYMPPEQARGERVDARADVWALGATLYDLLTGVRPFDGTAVYDVLVKVIEEEPRRPTALDPTVPRDLEAVVMKCLEKRPEDRYATAAELAEDLDRWLRGEAVAARAASGAYRLRKSLARRKGVVAIVAGAVILASLSAAVLVPLLRRTKTQAEDARDVLLKRMRESSSVAMDAALAARSRQDMAGMMKYGRELYAVCEQVVQAMPALAEPHYRMGRMQRVILDHESALREQEAALRKEPDFAPARYERIVLRTWVLVNEGGVILRQLQIRALGQLRDEGKLRFKAVKLPPWSHFIQGVEPLRKQAEAIEADLKALEASPRRGEVGEGELRCAAGLGHWLRGRNREAKAELAAALKLAPHLSEAVEALATAHLEDEETVEAEKLLTEALERDGGNVILWSLRGAARELGATGLTGEDRLRSAMGDYEAIQKLMPSRSSRLRRARVLSRIADAVRLRGGDARALMEESLREFEALKAEDPRDAEAKTGHAAILVDLAGIEARRGNSPVKRLEAACDEAKEAIALDNEAAIPWMVLGSARDALATWVADHGERPDDLLREAIEAYERAATRSANDESAWVGASRARLQLAGAMAARGEDPRRECARVMEDLKALARRQPQLAAVWTWGGRAAVQLGQYDAMRGEDPSTAWKHAEECLGEALRLEPAAAALWLLRADLRLKTAAFHARAEDPSRWYRSALEDVFEARRIDAGDPGTFLLAAGARLDWAGWMVSHETGDPVTLLREAEADVAETVKINPERDEHWRARGAVDLAWGITTSDDGAPAVARFRSAIGHFTKAVGINRQNADALAQRAHAKLWLARMVESERKEHYRAALADFEAALAVNPLRKAEVEEWMEECRKGE